MQRAWLKRVPVMTEYVTQRAELNVLQDLQNQFAQDHWKAQSILPYRLNADGDLMTVFIVFKRDLSRLRTEKPAS
jgi:hypothetical protein